MPRRDFVTSLLLLLLGVFTISESLRMPRMGDEMYAAPGLVPALLGGALVIFSILLLIRSILGGGWRLRIAGGRAPSPDTRHGVRQLSVALLLIVIYTAVLVDRIPYWLATALFVFAFITFFEWQPRVPGRTRLRHLGTALVQAVVVAAAVTVLFERLFRIYLP